MPANRRSVSSRNAAAATVQPTSVRDERGTRTAPPIIASRPHQCRATRTLTATTLAAPRVVCWQHAQLPPCCHRLLHTFTLGHMRQAQKLGEEATEPGLVQRRCQASALSHSHSHSHSHPHLHSHLCRQKK